MQVDPQPFRIASFMPEFERVKGNVEQARRFFVGQPVSGSVAGTGRIIDCLVGRVGRCGLRKVVSELGKRGIRFVLRKTLDGIGDAPM
jgi:hypothetical protein